MKSLRGHQLMLLVSGHKYPSARQFLVQQKYTVVHHVYHEHPIIAGHRQVYWLVQTGRSVWQRARSYDISCFWQFTNLVNIGNLEIIVGFLDSIGNDDVALGRTNDMFRFVDLRRKRHTTWWTQLRQAVNFQKPTDCFSFQAVVIDVLELVPSTLTVINSWFLGETNNLWGSPSSRIGIWFELHSILLEFWYS